MIIERHPAGSPRRLAACLCLLATWWCAPGAARAADWEFAATAAGDFWVAPELGGHGYLMADFRGRGLIAGGDLHINYNTETLLVGIERIPLADGKLEAGVIARGEYGFSGLLPDYYRRGLFLPERGFLASYVQGFAYLKWFPAPYQVLEGVVGGRRWFFGRGRQTSEELELPPGTWVAEPRLRYIYWRITSEQREYEAHRVFPRIEGVAAGVELGLDWRSEVAPWGARDPQHFDPVDPRNDPDATIVQLEQWLQAGLVLGSWRLQAREWLRWMDRGADDLVRARVGGLNPYVIPVPGLPWASLLAGRLGAAELGAFYRAGRHEIGLVAAGALVEDPLRLGERGVWGPAAGASLVADLRFGRWQLDGRLGAALPAAWQAAPPHLSLFFAVGRAF